MYKTKGETAVDMEEIILMGWCVAVFLMKIINQMKTIE